MTAHPHPDQAHAPLPRRIRRFARLALSGLAGGVLFVGVLFAGLQTPPGRHVLCRTLERAVAATPGLSARIDGLGGFLPFSIRLDTVALMDHAGPWLVISDFRLDWSLAALLAGRVEVSELSADIVRLLRTPELPEDEKSPDIPWPPALPDLPPVLVDRLAVSRLILDAAVTGERTETAVSGRISDSGGVVEASLSADRLDGPLAFARFTGRANVTDWTLTVALTAEEAAGGPLGAALDPRAATGESGPIRVDLKGEGPLNAWTARLAVLAANTPLCETDVSLRVPLEAKARATVDVTGYVSPPPGLAPPRIAAILGGRVDFSLSAKAVPGTDRIFLESSRVTAGPANLTLSGEVDPDNDRLRLDAALDIPDLSGFSPLTGEMRGSFAARLEASGNIHRPTARLTLSATTASTPLAALDDASFTFVATPMADLGEAFPGLSVAGSGRIDGLRASFGQMFPGRPALVALDAAVLADMSLSVRSLSITAGKSSLTAQVDLVRDGPPKGSCRLELADLGELSAGLGLPLAGVFRADAEATGQSGGQGLALKLKGGVSGLNALDPGVPAAALLTRLLGASPAFSGLARLNGNLAELSDFSLNGQNLRLTLTALADTAARTLAATAEATLPDLGPLSDAAGQPLRGALALKAILSGSLDSPDAETDIRLTNVRLGDLAATTGTILCTASDLGQRPHGRATAQAAINGQRLSLEAGWDMPPGRLDISGLAVSGPGARLSGDARIDLASGLATGNLAGGSTDLGRLGTVLGLPLSGAFALDATFSARGGGQDLRAALTGERLSFPGAAVSSLSVTAEVTDALRSPRGKAALRAAGVTASSATVSSLTLDASGRDGRGMDCTLQTQAHLDGLGPLGCEAAGRLSPTPGGLSLTLSRLRAEVNGLPVTLQRTAKLEVATDRLSVTDLRLGVGAGLFSAHGGFDSAKADMTVRLDMSLAEMAALGLPGLTGTAQAEMRVAGSGARPEAGLRLTAKGIGLPGVRADKALKLSLEAAADIGKHGLTASASITGPDKTPISARGHVPARLSLAPFAFDLPPQGPLSGTLEADVRLGDFQAFLAQAGIKATGRFTANLTASGPVSAPVFDGRAGLAEGGLEYAATGMRLRDIRLDLSASGKTITLTELSARDDGKGSLSASGRADVSPGEGFSMDVKTRFEALTVADMEMVKAALSGELEATGKGEDFALSGRLFIGPAQVNIPSRLPADVTQVDVVEINNPDAPARAKTKPESAPPDISLDVTVGVGHGVYVRGMGLESQWRGEVTALGTTAAPRLTGGVHTLQGGGVEFFGRRLELTTGKVTFSGETPPDPDLDVKASIAASDATCGVLVSGTAKAPRITLTADPPMPRDEILARILFGQSAGTLSAFQALQMAQAATALMSGGGTSLDLLSRTRRLAGLDELDFVPGQGGLETTRLRAAKYLAKGVKVTVDQGAAADSGSVAVEVDITPNISLESKVGADSNQGLGVNWKWDY